MLGSIKSGEFCLIVIQKTGERRFCFKVSVMYRKLASAVLVASAINAQYALAISLGGMTMHSALNQPLDAEIAISSAGDLGNTQILIGLASQDEFLKAGVDRSFFLSDIQFEIVLDGNGGGVVKLRSTKRLNEPYLDFLLEAKWPTGRMLRSYTALVDLPVYSEFEASAVDLGKSGPVSASKVTEQNEEIAPTQVQSLRPSAPSATSSGFGAIKPKATTTQATKTVVQTSGFTGSEYKIQPNETLSSIANKLKPNSQLTLNQTMLAIQKMNPHAFVRNNINLIRAGAVLRVPGEADVNQVSASAASKEVVQQTQEWRGAQLEATESRTAPQARPVSSAEEGHLSLTSAGSGLANGKDKSAADTSGLNQKLNAAKEGLEVSKLENKELNSRVDSLGTQVNQLKRMIELKDAELAALQKKLGKETQPKEPAKVVKEEVIAAKPLLGKDIEKPVDAKVVESAEVVPEQKLPEVAKEKPVLKQAKPKKPEPKTESKKPAKPVEPAVVEKTLLEKVQAKALYFGVFALVLIFGVVAFIFRRKAQAERQSMQENDISNFDFDEAVSEGSLDNLGSHEVADDFDSDLHSQPNVAEDHGLEDAQETLMQTSDPVGEADIYIAYGRYDQAAELLLNAIAASPGNTDLRTKLLEVYIESKNKAGFQQQYMELRSLGKAAAISHAKELLTSAEDVADWLNDLPSDEGTSMSQEYDLDDSFAAGQDDGFDLDMNVDAESGFSFKEEKPAVQTPVSSVIEDDFDLDLSDMDEASDLDFNLPESSQTLDSENTDSDFDADLSLDLSDLDSESGEAEMAFDLDSKVDEQQTNASNDDELSVDMDELSFDLSDEFEEKPAVSSSEDFSDLSSDDEPLDYAFEESETPLAAEVSVEEDLSFDGFDLDLDEEPVKAAEVEEDSALDFSDVDLGLGNSGLVSAEPTILRDAIDLSLADETSLDDLSATESAVEFDAGIEDVTESLVEEDRVSAPLAPAAAAVIEPHVSAPISALESEDLEFLTDGDEVSTKLDLAQAYVDLGDVDGARDILLEVMKEGKEDQKAVAAALLDSLD